MQESGKTYRYAWKHTTAFNPTATTPSINQSFLRFSEGKDMTTDSPLFLEQPRFVERKETKKFGSGRKLNGQNLSCKPFKPLKFEFHEDGEEHAYVLSEDPSDSNCQTFDDTGVVTTPTDDKSFCIPLPTDRISRSNSAVDLSKLGQGFHSDSHLDLSRHEFPDEILEEEEVVDDHEYYTADIQRKAPIELLPVEILDQIIGQLAIETPTNGYTPRNKDLASMLLVSRTMHSATLSTLYAQVSFPHSSVFAKFLAHIVNYPQLGELVRRLDFSYFTSIGLGRTKKMNHEIQRLTATTLTRCLNHTPRLREFLSSEALDEDMNEDVLRKLFCDMQMLEAVDFCAAATQVFVNAIQKVISPENPQLPEVLRLKRVGFHECTTLPASFFGVLLPRLSFVTHLDLTHTNVTDAILQTIPHTARITHLSLSNCIRLKGANVVDLLLTHPAFKNLIYLNLLYDTSKYRLLHVDDVNTLLDNIPKSLKSLNISGAKIRSHHVPQLRALAKQLEELSIGFADLTMDEVNMIVAPGYGDEPGCNAGIGTNFRSLFCKKEENFDGMALHNLRYLDLTGIADVNHGSLLFTQSSPLLLPRTWPLRVIELSERVHESLQAKSQGAAKLGWETQSAKSRRCWFIRTGGGTMPGWQKVERSLREKCDQRDWKMGAYNWGSRKIGMAKGEVVGIYGYYSYAK
ncbi:hypothetical protein BJ508DRAFT_329847 [Ascobolus immersus RN42]|uniref:RNI-like protein n=1 Tax=Ascobolus immersus RN42 TaxID=1160509 RepID=A0A3N4HXE2_ASCIM|nr:hypothetical protein BJ508DRAFT_329847 [Ascobolus immersus RN42]